MRIFGAVMLAPAAVALWYGERHDAIGFVGAAIITGGLGQLMRQAGGAAAEEAAERMRRIEGLAVVSASWLLIAALGRAALRLGWPRDRSMRSSSRCPA